MSFLRRNPFKSIFAFLCGLAVWLGARAVAFPALAGLFSAWNLNRVTYAYAPAWARFTADRSGEIIDIFALAVSTAVLFALSRPKRAPVWTMVFSLLAGALAAAVPVFVLLLADSARFSAARTFNAPAACVLLLREALFSAFSALLIYQNAANALPNRPKTAACACAALQAALFCFESGRIHITLAINGLLIGAAFSALFQKTRSPFPAAACAFAFRAVSRVAFGYPDLGGVYIVSEEWLAGLSAGRLEGAGIVTLLAAASLAASALIFRSIALPKSAHGQQR